MRSVRAAVATEGVLTTGRFAAGYLRTQSVDSLKSSFGTSLEVDFWASYNRRRAELWFDPRSVAEPFERGWVDPTTVQRRPVYGPFDRIRVDGYQTQDVLAGAGIDVNRFETSRDRVLTNEVGVNVGCDGSLLINSGFHRLAIARILRLDEIPVQVIVRHREWQRTRARAARGTKTTGGRVPSDLQSHPDLVDVLGGTSRTVST